MNKMFLQFLIFSTLSVALSAGSLIAMDDAGPLAICTSGCYSKLLTCQKKANTQTVKSCQEKYQDCQNECAKSH